jgi:hypothetical protein
MSDFLSSLFARSRGEAETLHPRRRSLFEPRDVNAAAPFETQPPIEDVELASPSPPPTQLLQRAPILPSAAAIPVTPTLADNVAAEPTEPVATASSGLRAEPPEPNAAFPSPPRVIPIADRSDSADPVPDSIRPVVAEPTPDPAAARVDQSSVAVDGSTEVSPEGPVPAAPAAGVASAGHPPDSPTAATQRFEHAPVRAELREATNAPAPRPDVVPVLLPRVQPERELSETPTLTRIEGAANSPPTIRVNIGRIDVRAAAAPIAAPQPQRPQRPLLSLEEYLRRRTGGSL